MRFLHARRDGAQLGMGRWVVFYGHRIAGTHQRLSALAVDDQGAEGHGTRGLETKGGKFDQCFEVGFIRRRHVTDGGLFDDLNGHGKV